MPPAPQTSQIYSEARGPHWIAWIAREGGSKPAGSIVFVGETQAEAEARARAFAEQPDQTSPG